MINALADRLALQGHFPSFLRKSEAIKGAVRKVCRCEPVTDVTGVAAPRLNGNRLVLLPRCLKIRGIATPACALVRNDRAFSNSPQIFSCVSGFPGDRSGSPGAWGLRPPRCLAWVLPFSLPSRHFSPSGGFPLSGYAEGAGIIPPRLRRGASPSGGTAWQRAGPSPGRT